jgi:hypothetical protein
MSVKDELSAFIEELKAGEPLEEGTPELDMKGRRVPEKSKKNKPSTLYDGDE